MHSNLFYTVILSGAFLLLFAVAELLYHKFGVKAEYTRKIVHIFTGLLVLSFPAFFDDHRSVLLLCGGFMALLLASLKFDFLPSINKVGRVTRGSLLYPIMVYVCFLVYNYFGQLTFYYIPLLVLAFCDPVAVYVGKTWPWGKYHIRSYTKTVSGSTGFMIAASIVSTVILSTLVGNSYGFCLLLGLLIAFATTIAEAIGNKGYDNLTIPIAALLVLYAAKDYIIY